MKTIILLLVFILSIPQLNTDKQENKIKTKQQLLNLKELLLQKRIDSLELDNRNLKSRISGLLLDIKNYEEVIRDIRKEKRK